MNRCIHCTRCVRFMTEIAGVEELGAIGRGEDMEITTYLERGILSEMQRQCERPLPGRRAHAPAVGAQRAPVGAAQDREHRRDGRGRLGHSRRLRAAARCMRILPRNNDAVNEEWISDKTRLVADGLRTQRLDQPYVRENGAAPATWDEALAVVAEKHQRHQPERMGAIAGALAGAEEMFALKDLLRPPRRDQRRLSRRRRQDRSGLGRASYLFNATIEGIERADAILLIGTNPRIEAAVLNVRIRKRWRQGGRSRRDRRTGRHRLSVRLSRSGRPDAARGGGWKASLRRKACSRQGPARHRRRCGFPRARMDWPSWRSSRKLRPAGKDADWEVFNVLHTAASRVAALDIGFVPGEGGLDTAGILKAAGAGELDLVWLLGADEIRHGQARQNTRHL